MPYKVEIEYRDYGYVYETSGRPWLLEITTPGGRLYTRRYHTRWGAVWATKRWVRGHKRAVRKANNPYVAEID